MVSLLGGGRSSVLYNDGSEAVMCCVSSVIKSERETPEQWGRWLTGLTSTLMRLQV